jgi:hypothetical protein
MEAIMATMEKCDFSEAAQVAALMEISQIIGRYTVRRLDY